VLRTSNAYQFRDPKGADSPSIPSNSELRRGTSNQDIFSLTPPTVDPENPLEAALLRLKISLGIEQGREIERRQARSSPMTGLHGDVAHAPTTDELARRFYL
jgi:hypothetical protein